MEATVPVGDLDQTSYKADNRFFNDEGSDRIAERHRPATAPCPFGAAIF